MHDISRALSRALVFPLALTLWACQDGPTPTDLLDVPVAQSVSIDFQAGDGDQFQFLPPLAHGQPSGAMATGLELSVTICGSSGCETIAAREQGDHYQANWKSDKAHGGEEYRVTVTGSGYLSGFTLGELRITLEKKGKDKAGSTFPIKFWVGENTTVAEISACVGDDRCNANVVPEDEETTIVTLDENGATMGELVFPPASVPAGGLVVTLDCRQGGYAPGDGPLPTDLDQWPLFCHVDARNPDGTEFTGTLPGQATLEICVVDEFESGQAPYHGFVDHHDLRLGKSRTGSDFTFLDEGPENLSCIGATTQTASASPVGRMFDAIGSRVARVLSPVLPAKLYARTMRFRDGGVGGLISSFSDINPVQPAVVGGTVSAFGGSAIPGVTVTLTGGPLVSPMATVTDVAGQYSFSPLQAEVGGSSYTVSVSGAPSFATPSQGVNVTGSGLFTADFQADPEPGIALVPGSTYDSNLNGNPAGGSAFVIQCAPGSVVVGLKGNTASWFGWATLWDVGVECAPLLPDGSLGPSVVMGSAGGGGGATATPFAAMCTGGQIVSGLTGNTTVTGSPYVVNSMGAGCSTVARLTGVLGGTDSTIGPWTGTGSFGTPTPWNEPCAPGYAVTGLIGQQGNILDAVGVQCTQVIDEGA